jgi:hypothetical protein
MIVLKLGIFEKLLSELVMGEFSGQIFKKTDCYAEWAVLPTQAKWVIWGIVED